MLSVRKRACPLDYSKCNQTITVYHRSETEVIRSVYLDAFLDFRKNRNIDKTGSKETNSFLLVIPGEAVMISPGDKVLLGIGAEITPQQWNELIPAKVGGLVVVKHVDPKYWQGKQCHIEAGG